MVLKKPLAHLGMVAGILPLLFALVSWNPIQNYFMRSSAFHSFYEQVAKVRPTTKDTVRLYLDRMGNIYPPKEFLPDSTFRQRKYYQVLTSWYYDPTHRAQLRALSAFCGVPYSAQSTAGNYCYPEGHWWKIQDALARRVAHETDQRTKGKRPLVMLVHGYNNSDTDMPFLATRNVLRQQEKLKDAVWMEVRWDGLHKPTPVFIWGAAQLNGRYAGIGVRRVLCRTLPTTPVRIFTHSSGAFVVYQALWNSSPLMNEDPHSDILCACNMVPTPTHLDIRVGSMAPATTPFVFRSYFSRTVGNPDKPTECQLATTGPRYRIVAGQNQRDVAVTKYGKAAGRFGATNFGSDSLAFVQANGYCSNCVERIDFVQARGKNPSPAPYGLGRKGLLEEHDWGLYWQRPQHVDFLNKVL
jgi:hypothetical protein